MLFLDIEASSLSEGSYPIEVAWGDESGQIESHLINPYLYPDSFTDWSPDAQAVHGLSRDYLNENGKHPKQVAERLCSELNGHLVVSDAPDFDNFWLQRLFDAVGMSNLIEIQHIESQLQKVLPIEYWMSEPESDKLPIEHIYERALEKHPLPMHRAANDVEYLISLYKEAKKVSNKK